MLLLTAPVSALLIAAGVEATLTVSAFPPLNTPTVASWPGAVVGDRAPTPSNWGLFWLFDPTSV